MFIEISLKKILSAFMKWIWWILLAAFAGGAAAYAFTIYMIVPQYSSSISLYVYNSASRESMATASDINIGDIYASQSLVNTYIVVLRDDIVFESAAERLLEEYSEEWLARFLPVISTPQGTTIPASSLRGMVSMGSINDTEVLRITAQTRNPELSARICMILAESASDVLKRVVKAGSVEIISPAKPASSPSSPNVMNNCIIGFIIGGFLLSAIMVITVLTDNTVKSEEDLKNRFNIPVLGDIPDFRPLVKGKYRGYSYGGLANAEKELPPEPDPGD